MANELDDAVFSPDEIKNLYGKVGLVVALSQMIEYNLANIISLSKVIDSFGSKGQLSVREYSDMAVSANKEYESLIKATLGHEKSIIDDTNILDEQMKETLKDIVTKRNFVVHQLFKNDIIDKSIQNDIGTVLEYLDGLLTEMKAANDALCLLMANTQKEANQLLDKKKRNLL